MSHLSQKYSLTILILLSLLLSIQACSTDDPAEENEVELINEVHLKFTPVGGGNEIEWVWSVEEGSNAEPVITTTPLAANTQYDLLVEFYGEPHDHEGEDDHSEEEHSDDEHSGEENITEEIRTEGAEHQVFFIITPANLGITLSYEDADTDGNPIGLINTVSTTGAGSGEMNIVLRHDLNKSAAGVSSGDITNAGGSTDVSVSFPVVIQ